MDFVRPSIFIFSPVPWSGLRQRHQALAAGLSRAGHAVTYVEPLVTPGFSVVCRRETPSLTVVSIRVPFRATAHPAVQHLVCRWALRLLNRHFQVSCSSSWCWVGDPSLAAVARRSWGQVIYDRCDRHGFFPGQRPPVWERYERHLCRRADLIVASNSFLLRGVSRSAQHRTLLLPNAGRDDFRSQPLLERAPTARLQVVSAGAHFEWTDFDWLDRFAAHPRVDLHIAGRGRGPRFQRLLQQPRVVAHGALGHEDLRRLLDRCHLGLVPFLNLPLMEGVDPIKVYEYAQRGLHIWGTPCRSLQQHCFVDETPAPSDVTKRLDAEDPGQWRPRSGLHQVPVWADRLATLLPILRREGSEPPCDC